LAKITPADAGSSVRNPVEIGLGRKGLSEYYGDGIKVVAADPQIDFVITFLNPEDYVHYGIGNWSGQVSNGLIDIGKSLEKPLVVAFLPARDPKVFESIIEIQDRCQREGIPCFSSLDSAIKALGKLVSYYEFKSSDVNG
jgi:hypothetical protein